MPEMSGTQLAEAIKLEWPDLTVLLATGYADRAPGENIALPRLTKPFLEDELAAAIARLKPGNQNGESVVSLRTRSRPSR